MSDSLCQSYPYQARVSILHHKMGATCCCHFHPSLPPVPARETIFAEDRPWFESLTWLSNFKEPEGQLARWLERLQEYDFRINHRPGHKHQNADSLSRHPCTQCGRVSHIKEPKPDVIAVEQHVTPALVQKSSDQLQQLQLDDGPVGLLLRAIEKAEKPTSEDARGQGPELSALRNSGADSSQMMAFSNVAMRTPRVSLLGCSR